MELQRFELTRYVEFLIYFIDSIILYYKDIDVHLMVQPVDALIQDFAKAGASYITFHPEASNHVDRSLSLIRSAGLKSGLVLTPSTSLEYCKYVLDKIDIILLMSVNPGFGGQSFIPTTLTVIYYISNY